MKNNKDDLYSTLVPSLKDKFFQQQLNFEEEQKEESNGGKKYFKYFAYAASLTVAVTVFSYLAFTAYKYSAKPESIQDIPLVKKDITPIRTIPSDPGGEKFSNQDKLIYNNLLDNSVEKAEAPEPELRSPVETPKPKLEAKAEPVKKQVEETPQPQIPASNPSKQEEPKKITTKIKTKVAKTIKKIDNPFDILDSDMSALETDKIKN